MQKHCFKREGMNLFKIFPLLVITLVSACKSRSKQWEKGEEKQHPLSIGLGIHILAKIVTPKELNIIHNSSA
jgi:hypothetical protein